MQTYLLMGLFLLFFAIIALFGMRNRTPEDSYYDLDDTNVLRGLWCLVVILVHIPTAYQNRIQDMIGSFAYIGVTFFFMTSAYGLAYGVKYKKGYLKGFWIQRLPQLLVPAIIVNVLSICNNVFLGGDTFHILSLIRINGWVIVLLIFYFAFWLVNILFRKFAPIQIAEGVLPDCVVSLVIVAYSLTAYFFGYHFGTQWPTECFGFIYGLIFFRIRLIFKEKAEYQWLLKTIMITIIGLILGIAYLKFKPVVFIGDYLLKIVLGLALTVLILQLIVKVKIGNKISRFLGGISYEVYLLHHVTFTFLQNIVPNISSGIYVWCAVLITVAVAFIVKYLSDRLVHTIRGLVAG